ncbi:UDP-2,3-diacylglucosamine diphosphatase [uncultured Maribacter sp.]|uniref:UDP-2,3-diacylglucosamine diphosphatase n=1 Tax=uncultured Maribacter sp. TaxID=431308 RepID=UPI002605372D|nr:UDP-2,3-diacylglucosamine diphosphatase [uncultured Maribacter sp.]
MKKRKIKLAVISDVHLGTSKSHAQELINYLNSIQPKTLILNGDILDTWNESPEYFPNSHLKVIRKILSMASKGTKVVYITGNHDERLRRFSSAFKGNLKITNKLVLELDGKRAWFFHGDIFDISTKNSKWIAKIGSVGYQLLHFINKCNSWFFKKLGKPRYSLSDKLKKGISNNIKTIDNFEKTVTELAIDNGYSYVVCGHTHLPKKEIFFTDKGKCTYLNSGDWVENLTALEYSFKRWKIYRYSHDKLIPFFVDEELKSKTIHELVSSLYTAIPTKLKTKAALKKEKILD